MIERRLSRRTLVKGAAATAATTATVGVSKRSTAFAAPAVLKQNGKIKVVYWDSLTALNSETVQEVIKRFNESQQEVEVEYQFQGTYQETAQKLRAALQARQAPDVSLLSEVNWFQFYLSDFLAPMNDFITANEVDTADYVDSFYNEGVRDDTLYWLSFARSTPLFYYNKEIFSEVGLPDRGPETWSELAEWAPELVTKDGDEVTRYAHAWAPAKDFIAWYFQGMIWAFGGAYSTPDFTITIAEPAGVEAGNYLRTSVADGWAYTPAERRNDFYTGLTATILQSTGQIGNIGENAPFEFGTAFLPKEKQPGVCTGGAGMAILSTSPPEKQEAAFQFLAFATSPEITTYWSQTTGYMPVRKSAIESPEMLAYFEENPNFKVAVDQLPTTQQQDAARLYIADGDTIIGQGLERITINQEEVQPVFDDVKSQLEEEAQPIVEAIEAMGS